MSLSKSVSIALPILASAAYVVELSFVPLVLPQLQAELDLSRRALAWVFNAYVAAVAVGVLVGGRLGDSFGPQRVFAFGVALFVLGSVAVALASEQSWILAGRVLQGFGGGLFSPVIPVLLSRAANNKPGRLLMLWGSISGLVAGLAPLFAHYVIGSFGWALVFFTLAVIAAPALFIAATPDGMAPEAAKEPTSLSQAVRQPLRVWSLYGFVFCNFGAIMLFIFLLPLSLASAGYTPLAQAWVMLIFWAVFAVSGVVLRNAVDGRAIWWVLLASPACVLGGYLFYLMGATTLWMGLAAALVAVGFACGNATSTTLILRLCRDGTDSVAASFDISVARLGAALVIWVAAPMGPEAVVTLVAALCVATVVFGILPSPALSRSPRAHQG